MIALRTRQAWLGNATYAAATLPLFMLFSQFLAANAALKSARPLAEAIAVLHPATVHSYRDYETTSSLAWYLDRPIEVIDIDSRELWYGLKLKPEPTRFPSASRLARTRGHAHAAMVVLESDLPAIRQGPLVNMLVDSGSFGRVHLLVAAPNNL